MARIVASILVLALAVVGSYAAPAEQPELAKRDLTSHVSEIFGYTNGTTVYSRCYIKTGKGPKTYNSNDRGVCSTDKDNCGREVYAYIGKGDGPLHTKGATSVIDICPPNVPKTESLGVTYATFKQLGGNTKTKKAIKNVNYKFLD